MPAGGAEKMPAIVSIMPTIFLIQHARMIFWRFPQYFPCPLFYHAHNHLCNQVCLSIVMSPSPCHIYTNIFVFPKSSSNHHKMGHLTLQMFHACHDCLSMSLCMSLVISVLHVLFQCHVIMLRHLFKYLFVIYYFNEIIN